MLRRKISDFLLRWKNSASKHPLVIKGCRQCGKTSSVLEFAQKNYQQVVYINFLANPAYSDIFKDSLEIDHLTMMMSVMLRGAGQFVPGETVIIFDEIQECAEARTSLKFFALDARYDVIATGSMLGVKGYGHEPRSIPVGYEQTVAMYPMDFEEFLWANNIEDAAIALLRECLLNEKAIPQALHGKLQELMLQYVVVGGMPAVVQNFVDNHDMRQVLSLQKDLLQSYEDDIVKYAVGNDKARIRACFRSIPKQLAKENKKFQYSLVERGGKAANMQSALEWLADVGLIKLCHNLSVPELPLEGNSVDNIFKVYMLDSGLFVAMLEEGTQADILQGNLLSYKGAIMENLIADFLGKKGKKLYYFRKDSGLEIDFVIRYHGKATLLEVKAQNGNYKSVKSVLAQPERYHVKEAIKLANTQLNRNGAVLSLPLYMGAFLE